MEVGTLFSCGWNVDNMAKSVWNDCLRILVTKLTKESFSTWLKPTQGLETFDDTLVIGVPNQFVADWLQEHYLTEITQSLAQASGRNLKVSFSVASELAARKSQTELVFAPPAKKNGSGWPARADSSNLNLNYSFANFVVGEGNRFARAAAMAVAEAPGQTRYNPLYIYGGVGLGKTHLVQALGNFALGQEPGLKVIYASSEKFTNDFIQSLGKAAMPDFIGLYREVDLLLIDDIQFLAGKESTQAQFFHTFNALHLAGKQIVLTSDRSPRDIKGLEERLLSRFQWGLVTDIQPPDLETRIAILNKKAEADGVIIPIDVAHYIAEHFTSNVRELEGALIRLLAFASISACALNLDLAKQVLGDITTNGKKDIRIDDITRQVASYYQLSCDDLLSKRKTAEVAWARQVGMYLARDLTESSLKSIGAQFGGRDHSTVIHACSVVSQAIKEDPGLRKKIDQIINSLYGH